LSTCHQSMRSHSVTDDALMTLLFLFVCWMWTVFI